MLAGLVLAGCGSSSTQNGAGTRPNLLVTAAGTFGHAPAVTIPAKLASADLVGRTLVPGSGSALTGADAMLANYSVYTWDGTKHKQVDSSYAHHQPQWFPTVPSLPGLKQILPGRAKAGSRILVVVPPKFAFGSAGNPRSGITARTTLVFVFDVLGVYPAGASASGSTVGNGGGTLPTVTVTSSGPAVTMPKNSPPSGLVVKTLIKGTGRAVSKSDFIVVQYTGYDWQSGKSFDSSWSRKQLLGTQLSSLIPGWINGLPGQTVGSRVMLVIPASQGYGSKGQPSGGIKGGDTLVFVIDIVDAVASS
jgi:peptidylprolyl isomerase